MKKTIPPATIKRLPLYYRTLKSAESYGIELLSSHDLGKMLELTPEQIRKDLAFFGNFGMKGVGYHVKKLRCHIEKILGLQHRWRLAIIGMGSLGISLANYKNFTALGFQIAALFDIDRDIIGTEINNLKVYDFKKIKSIAPRKLLDIGVIAVPISAAQSVADNLIRAGIKGIWNFAPVKLEVPPDISIVNEDLTFGLSTLSYRLAQGSN